jgi:integrase
MRLGVPVAVGRPGAILRPELVRRTGIHDCTFHDLRRTYASRLVNRGVSLSVIAKLLGHGATYVTERYAHVARRATRPQQIPSRWIGAGRRDPLIARKLPAQRGVGGGGEI